jgi:AcrR family transcriptional regulator
MPPEGTARRYHHGDLRNALIIAAAELIEESGSEDFAMVDAARRAGVSSAAPYRHFRDKEDLLRAVGDLGFCGLGERMIEVRERFEHGSIECIIEMGRRYIAFVTAKPAFFDVMWGERGITADDKEEDGDSQARMNGFYLFVDQVQGWCERERLRDEDPMDLAMKLWAMAMGLSQLAINHNMEKFVPDVDPYEMLTSFCHAFLDGVVQGQQ